MKINWIDIIVVAFIVWSFFLGKKRGLSVEILALVVAILSWVIALHFYQGVGQSLNTWFLINLDSARAISFIIIAVTSLFIFTALVKMLKKAMNLSFTPNIEKIGGYIIGAIRGIVISAIVVISLVLIPAGFIQQEVYTNSFLGNYLVALSSKAHGWLWPGNGQADSKFNMAVFWAQLPQRPKGEIL